MIASTRSKQNENDDQCDDHVTTYFSDRLKQVEKKPFHETCLVNVVYALFNVIDSPRESVYIYTFQIVVNSAEASFPYRDN